MLGREILDVFAVSGESGPGRANIVLMEKCAYFQGRGEIFEE